jgi:hypothetical protein
VQINSSVSFHLCCGATFDSARGLIGLPLGNSAHSGAFERSEVCPVPLPGRQRRDSLVSPLLEGASCLLPCGIPNLSREQQVDGGRIGGPGCSVPDYTYAARPPAQCPPSDQRRCGRLWRLAASESAACSAKAAGVLQERCS